MQKEISKRPHNHDAEDGWTRKTQFPPIGTPESRNIINALAAIGWDNKIGKWEYKHSRQEIGPLRNITILLSNQLMQSLDEFRTDEESYQDAIKNAESILKSTANRTITEGKQSQEIFSMINYQALRTIMARSNPPENPKVDKNSLKHIPVAIKKIAKIASLYMQWEALSEEPELTDHSNPFEIMYYMHNFGIREFQFLGIGGKKHIIARIKSGPKEEDFVDFAV
ncbi:MAG: hypothetical protein COU27_01760 [Candidatus Levybacteria bacterium CG10_big_fil_rev_8_21_14_0_10_36_7]|nr:MAG: hypothetical protein COU27_01760 [Candidatus Levybacteria bacterium CG10_big_fil_rev_8_21_14_0_10_36_7]